jgi:hypothetical protein
MTDTALQPSRKSLRERTESLFRRAHEVHGENYSYGDVRYVDSVTKIAITCGVHGLFWQLPSSHLIGRGCIACAGKVRRTTEQFVREAVTRHGSRYGYDECRYTKNSTPVAITCRLHGSFFSDQTTTSTAVAVPLQSSGLLHRRATEFRSGARREEGHVVFGEDRR